MIDDHLKNLDNCQGEPILFTSFHNINITKYPRVNTWPEAVDYLMKAISHDDLQQKEA